MVLDARSLACASPTQTRQVWLVLVYLTLDRLRYTPKKGITPPKPDDTLGLESLVESTCDAVGAVRPAVPLRAILEYCRQQALATCFLPL